MVQVQLDPTLRHPNYTLYLNAHLNDDGGISASLHPHFEGSRLLDASLNADCEMCCKLLSAESTLE